MNSVRVLMHSVIDYAGLFPPAGLEMAEAVRAYADFHSGELSWISGRFVLPASRLEEFEASVRALQLPRSEVKGWRLSVLGTGDHEADLMNIVDFNRRSAANAVAVDVIELKVVSTEAIQLAAAVFGDRLQVYFEIPISDVTRRLIVAAAHEGARVKVRTGGTTPEMFPSPSRLAEFIFLCAEQRIPFKATAGLHHAFRSIHPLTYETSSASGVMHGFLNVLLASASTHTGDGAGSVEAILSEQDAEAFRFEDNTVFWRNQRFAIDQLRDMRMRLFTCFGSCTFREPTSELKALKLL